MARYEPLSLGLAAPEPSEVIIPKLLRVARALFSTAPARTYAGRQLCPQGGECFLCRPDAQFGGETDRQTERQKERRDHGGFHEGGTEVAHQLISDHFIMAGNVAT